jgi:hypothetical protein
MAKGEITIVPSETPIVKPQSSTPKNKKGNLANSPMVARGMGANLASEVKSQSRTGNSPPQNLQNPLTALFGDRMKHRKQK